MKHISTLKLLLILFSLLTLPQRLFSAGQSCTNPNVVIPSSTFAPTFYWINNYSTGISWYKFTATDASMRITSGEYVDPLTTGINEVGLVHIFTVFSGLDCNNLSIVNDRTFPLQYSSVRDIDLENLTINDVYWIKVENYVGFKYPQNIQLAFINKSATPQDVICTSNPDFTISSNSFGSQLFSALPVVNQQRLVANKKFVVRNNVEVFLDEDTKFENCEFEMGFASKLSFNMYLGLSNCHLKGCDKMWQGIESINSGTSFEMNQNSVIEDAVNGVSITAKKCTLRIESSVFNRNINSIVVDKAYDGIENSSFISNVVFTSRDISYPVSSIAQLKVNLTSFPEIKTKIPYSYECGGTGISFTDINPQPITTCNVFTIGTPLLGSTAANLFDNLMYGIVSVRSKYKVKNNRFVNLKSFIRSDDYGSRYFSSGIGVSAAGQAVNSTDLSITIGGYSSGATNYEKKYF